MSFFRRAGLRPGRLAQCKPSPANVTVFATATTKDGGNQAFLSLAEDSERLEDVDQTHSLVYIHGSGTHGGYMITVNVHEAKTHLSRLLTQIASGEEVTISRYGKPIARLVNAQPRNAKRRGGVDRGLLRVPEDFNDEITDVTGAFES